MKVAKLFMNGRSQAVRLPREFRFKGKRVLIKRAGNAVVLIPEEDSWQALLDSLGQFSGDFMQEREQPSQAEEREDLFA
jgi:antitoxin VapB